MKQLRIRQGTRPPMNAVGAVKNYQTLTTMAQGPKDKLRTDFAKAHPRNLTRHPHTKNADYPPQDAFRLTRVNPRESMACLDHAVAILEPIALLSFPTIPAAGVAKLVYAPDSKSGEVKLMSVRVRPPAP